LRLDDSKVVESEEVKPGIGAMELIATLAAFGFLLVILWVVFDLVRKWK